MKFELNCVFFVFWLLFFGVVVFFFVSFFVVLLFVEIFKICMKSGNEFVSKYKFCQVWYFEDKFFIMIEVGNIVVFDKSEIEMVESDIEFCGFGVVIDIVMVMVGVCLNDMLVFDDDVINVVFDCVFCLQLLCGMQMQNFFSLFFFEFNGGGGFFVGFLNIVILLIGNLLCQFLSFELYLC